MDEDKKLDENSTSFLNFFKPIHGIPLLIGLLGIALAIYFYVNSIKDKEPCYSTTVPEAMAKSSLNSPRIKIIWDSTLVENVMFVKIAIWNDGDEYIDSKDISEIYPIVIKPERKIKILSSEIIRKSRANLNLNTFVEIDSISRLEYLKIKISPDEALEKNDGVLIGILYTGSEEVTFNVSGRIKGVTEGFKNMSRSQDNKINNFSIAISALLVAVASFMSFLLMTGKVSSLYFRIFAICFLIMFMIVIIYSFYNDIASKLPNFLDNR